MSSKEDGSKDKKTKKKKTVKPTEEKPKEEQEEPVVEKESVETAAVQEQAESEKSEAPANKEENPIDVPQTAEESVPDNTAAEPSTKNIKKDTKPSKTEDNRGSKKKEKDEIKPMDLENLMQLKEAFSLFDFNHDGIIELQDLKYTFASLGNPNFPEENMKKMLEETTDPVDFDAFVALFGYKVSTLDSEDVFSKALSTWDMRGVGMIPEASLKHDIRCFGDKFTGKETDCALEEAPVYVNEGTSMIDHLKFSNNICGFRNVEKTRRYQKEIENSQAHK